MNGHSPDDLTELAIRSSVLGERPKTRDSVFGYLTEMPDPLVPLRHGRIAEDSLRPIAELLLTETIVGDGRVARITKFQLGPSVAGHRRIALEWETPRRASNQKQERREIAGSVKLA